MSRLAPVMKRVGKIFIMAEVLSRVDVFFAGTKGR